MNVTLLFGDVVEQLRTLPDESVQVCVTSPPYWGLRSYLPDDHPLKALEIGNEPTVDEFIDLPGFADALAGVGWLRSGHGQVWLTGFCQPCANRKGIAASVRADVLATGACEACGSGDEPEIDHDVPISRGGSCDRSNLQRLCSSCNRAKGRRTMAEFMAARSGSA